MSRLCHLMYPVVTIALSKPAALLLLLSLLFLSDLAAQSRQQLERERVALEEQIQTTRQLLDESIEQRRSTVENYVALQNQLEARRNMVSNLQSQTRILRDTMENLMDSIELLNEHFEEVRGIYFQQLRISYLRQLTTRDWMYLLSSGNLNTALKRYFYNQQFQSFIDQKKMELDSISDQIAYRKAAIQESLDDLGRMQTREQRTVKELNRDLRTQDALLNSLRGKEQELRENLKEQESRRRELSRKIDRLIAEEIARRDEAVEELPERAAEYELLSGNFEQNKGQIPWPVERGVIQSHFGNQAHPTLRNVTIQNNGIDIQTLEGTPVRSVFEGQVTAVVTMPGDQYMVLVRHGNYFTVYAGLNSTYVSRDQQVKAGEELGVVGKDPGSGNFMVHFELWRGKDVLNPEEWISR
ncbi:MAG: hypothetical protein EA411_06110 [Saprospirales bacterium]|nr:MAG: hypothetical protein EA411_06110 [Saprospirales bacterium]